MSDLIQPSDYPLLQAIPERDIVEMAIDLDILVPEKIDRMQMLERCVLAIVARGQAEGLPFSQYDQDDLEDLQPMELKAIGSLNRINEPITVAKILKKGRKIYKSYQKHRPDNPTALLIPTLLPIIARAALRATIE